MQYSQGLIDAANASTPQSEYASLSKGTNQSGLIDSGASFDNTLAYKPQTDAIRSKYMQGYNTQMAGLENKMSLESKNASFNKIAVATEAAAQEAQLNFQKELMKYKQKMAKRAQRMATIGTVLNVAGTAGGFAVGGPAGAVVGGAVANQAAGGMANG
jgi:hypothetical protein